MYDSSRRHRLSIRLRKYDYTWAGMYFVTVCTHLRRCPFGEVTKGEMVLNEAGRLVERSLLALPKRFSGVRIDTHVVMPNHVHALLAIANFGPDVEAPSLGKIVRFWKASSCRLVRSSADPCFGWQRNYYERILRNEDESDRVRHYIAANPAAWDRDEENPERF